MQEQKETKRVDIAIVMPHANRSIEYQGVHKSLRAAINLAMDKGYTFAIHDPASASVARNRNVGVYLAMKQAKPNWIFMADDDMMFPKDTFLRLIEADKNIVSGLCVVRSSPYNICAYKKIKEGYRTLEHSELDGVMEVDAVGGACVLIKAEIFESIPAPWYAMPPRIFSRMLHIVHYHQARGLKLDEHFFNEIPEFTGEFSTLNGETEGEDVYFCGLVKKFGYKIHLDTGLKVGHIGDYIYSIDDHVEYRRVDDELADNKASGATAGNPADRARTTT